MMSVREIRSVFGTMANGSQGTDDLGTDAKGAGAGTPSCCSKAGGHPATAAALERDPHTIGRWAAAFGEGLPRALIFEQTGGSPRPWRGAAGGLRAAVQQLPAAAGLDLANWSNWKVVHRFVWERFGQPVPQQLRNLCGCRLGFAFKRPSKRLLKADEDKREATWHAAVREEAVGSRSQDILRRRGPLPCRCGVAPVGAPRGEPPW